MQTDAQKPDGADQRGADQNAPGVLENLESIRGALLRVNRSIQAEGAFGVMKQDRRYRRIVRRGINSARVEIFLVCIGYNLYERYNKQTKTAAAA